MDLGIILDGSRPPAELTTLARAAEAHELAVIVLETPAADAPALDRWTLAVWLAGATRTIPVLLPDAEPGPVGSPTDPEAEVPEVVAKATESADTLTGGRVTRTAPFWVRAEAGASPESLRDLAADGATVAIEASSVEQIERLARELQLTRQQRWRSPAARARRLPGIDYDGVPATLAEHAIEPGDADYRAVSSTYLRGGAPGLVLRPRTQEEVADALAFARRHRHLPLGIRSAGHGISGRSTNRGGLVIDVSAINEVSVLDRASRTIRVGPGATWKKVATAIAPYGWAISSGDYGGVGVGGLATAGGIGLLGREQGLTIDRVRAVELVLPDGRQVRASATENPDLFWAVRGAGASFGVATAFEIDAAPVGTVGWAQLVFVVDDIAEALVTFGEVASAAPRDTTVFLVTGPPQGGRSAVQLFGVVDSPDPDTIIERLNPFTTIGMLAQQNVRLAGYHAVIGWAPDVGPEGHHGFAEPTSRSALLPSITPAFAREAAALLATGDVHFFQLRTMGGAIADVAPEATAFAHRGAGFSLVAMGRSDAAVRQGWDRIRSHAEGLYVSFETDTDPARLADAYPPATLARLRELKRRYDPEGLLRDNFAIDPAAPATADALQEASS